MDINDGDAKYYRKYNNSDSIHILKQLSSSVYLILARMSVD